MTTANRPWEGPFGHLPAALRPRDDEVDPNAITDNLNRLAGIVVTPWFRHISSVNWLLGLAVVIMTALTVYVVYPLF